MKKIIFIQFIICLNLFAYEKGKIDMHGGQTDSLKPNNSLDMAIGLGRVLNKKSSDEKIEKKEDKNFMKIEKIEDIEKIKETND